MSSDQPAKVKTFPEALPLRKLIGPSFIILALGLGSGEVILWPYLASNYGLGMAWGAIVGISFQYFINMEIERYALIKGESVFVGIAKILPWAPYWFIASTFVGFGLPGIVAASATVFASLVGDENVTIIGTFFMIAIGLILSSGKTVYGLMEKLTRTILMFGVPFVFLLTLFLASRADWVALLNGLRGVGEGYRFLPAGLALATFLAAFAYSGAGGNLNLTQSIYVKEKGYGMGKYAERVAGLFHKGGVAEEVHLAGATFEDNPTNRKRFLVWWRRISIEHALVFWLVGGISILLLMLLSYATTYGLPDNTEGISFVLREGAIIGSVLGPRVGFLFLLVVAIMLFQTQLGVMDSTSRIMAENAALISIGNKKQGSVPLAKMYFGFLWTQIAFGIVLFLLGIVEPKSFLILGACINAFAMFVHVGLVTYLNKKALPSAYQPSLWRRCLLIGIFLFFGFFSAVVGVNLL